MELYVSLPFLSPAVRGVPPLALFQELSPAVSGILAACSMGLQQLFGDARSEFLGYP